MTPYTKRAEEEVGEKFGFVRKHDTWYFVDPPHAALSVAKHSNLTTGDKLCLAMDDLVEARAQLIALREAVGKAKAEMEVSVEVIKNDPGLSYATRKVLEGIPKKFSRHLKDLL